MTIHPSAAQAPSEESILHALRSLRAPIQRGEYDLHRLVMDCLESAGLPCTHEVPLGPNARIDVLCGHVGIEIKRGHVGRSTVLRQLERYAASPEIGSLILVTEHTLNLPRHVGGKPLSQLCLARLWGIAL